MKHRLLPVTLVLSATLAFAAEPPPPGTFDLHGDRVELVEGTLSADGRYAAAWTVLPKKGQPLVDWSKRELEDTSFYEAYLDNENYTVIDVIVDVPRRAIAAKLKFTEPYFGGKNHGGFNVVYGPEHDGRRYAVALSDSKWEPNDVVLAELSADGATQADVRKPLDAAVEKYIRAKRNPKAYVTDYQLGRLPETGLITGFSDAATVRIPFVSEIPKNESTPVYFGAVQLRLKTEKGQPRAEAVEARAMGEQPDLVADNPRVVAADKELNAAYSALRTKLDTAGKAKLQAEQRQWIKERDEKIAELEGATSEKTPMANPRLETDRALLRLTTERTAALRAR